MTISTQENQFQEVRAGAKRNASISSIKLEKCPAQSQLKKFLFDQTALSELSKSAKLPTFTLPVRWSALTKINL